MIWLKIIYVLCLSLDSVVATLLIRRAFINMDYDNVYEDQVIMTPKEQWALTLALVGGIFSAGMLIGM